MAVCAFVCVCVCVCGGDIKFTDKLYLLVDTLFFYKWTPGIPKRDDRTFVLLVALI
jgi:hypothetical protein